MINERTEDINKISNFISKFHNEKPLRRKSIH